MFNLKGTSLSPEMNRTIKHGSAFNEVQGLSSFAFLVSLRSSFEKAKLGSLVIGFSKIKTNLVVFRRKAAFLSVIKRQEEKNKLRGRKMFLRSAFCLLFMNRFEEDVKEELIRLEVFVVQKFLKRKLLIVLDQLKNPKGMASEANKASALKEKQVKRNPHAHQSIEQPKEQKLRVIFSVLNGLFGKMKRVSFSQISQFPIGRTSEMRKVVLAWIICLAVERASLKQKRNAYFSLEEKGLLRKVMESHKTTSQNPKKSSQFAESLTKNSLKSQSVVSECLESRYKELGSLTKKTKSKSFVVFLFGLLLKKQFQSKRLLFSGFYSEHPEAKELRELTEQLETLSQMNELLNEKTKESYQTHSTALLKLREAFLKENLSLTQVFDFNNNTEETPKNLESPTIEQCNNFPPGVVSKDFLRDKEVALQYMKYLENQVKQFKFIETLLLSHGNQQVEWTHRSIHCPVLFLLIHCPLNRC